LVTDSFYENDNFSKNKYLFDIINDSTNYLCLFSVFKVSMYRRIHRSPIK